MLIVFFLSIYMVVDRDQIVAFLFRLVPPAYAEEARLLADVGVALVRRLPARPGADGRRLLPDRARHEPAARACRSRRCRRSRAGVLQAIPFFGPFVSWAPPVIVALVLQPSALLPDGPAHGHRLVRGDERPPAADHAGRGRHPPDRGPRLGPHRLADRRASPAPSSGSRSPPSCRRSSSSSSTARPATGPSPGGRPAASPSARVARSTSRASRRPGTRDRTSTTRDRPPTQTDERPSDADGHGRRPSRPGHDPRAGADRAPRPRQGARRAARRRRRARRPARRCATTARPLGRVDEPAADPGHQRRRRRVARAARAQAGARPDRRRRPSSRRTPTRARSATRRR